MKLDGQEFEIKEEKINEFFSYLDTLNKQILSKNITKKGEPKISEDYVLFIVSDHAIGLPKEAKAHIEQNKWIVYK